MTTTESKNGKANSKAAKRGRGAPRKGKTVRANVFSFRGDDELAAKVEELIQRYGMERSEALARAVEIAHATGKGRKKK